MTIFDFSRIAAIAVPKNSENTTICRISLRAIASRTLVGIVCSMNDWMLMPVACTPDAAFAAGSGRCIALPGSSVPTRIRPSVSERSDAKMNHASALPPTRPTVAMSPIFAMPTTSVENTSGAMIILMSRRNALGNSSMISANRPLPAGNI
jgi:hypothetical protein